MTGALPIRKVASTGQEENVMRDYKYTQEISQMVRGNSCRVALCYCQTHIQHHHVHLLCAKLNSLMEMYIDVRVWGSARPESRYREPRRGYC